MGVGLWVGPFSGTDEANDWVQRFIRATTLGWDELALRKRSPIIEARTVRGALVEKLTGTETYTIAVRPPNGPTHPTVIRFDIGEAGVERRIDSPNLVWDIYPEDATPEKVAVDLEYYVLANVRRILDKI
jgi:hypothetical protein